MFFFQRFRCVSQPRHPCAGANHPPLTHRSPYSPSAQVALLTCLDAPITSIANLVEIDPRFKNCTARLPKLLFLSWTAPLVLQILHVIVHCIITTTRDTKRARLAVENPSLLNFSWAPSCLAASIPDQRGLSLSVISSLRTRSNPASTKPSVHCFISFSRKYLR